MALLPLAYTHPRTGALTTIEELVRVTDPDGWVLRLGEADLSVLGRATERAATPSGIRFGLASRLHPPQSGSRLPPFAPG